MLLPQALLQCVLQCVLQCMLQCVLQCMLQCVLQCMLQCVFQCMLQCVFQCMLQCVLQCARGPCFCDAFSLSVFRVDLCRVAACCSVLQICLSLLKKGRVLDSPENM